jgi:hypothetical protein
MKKIALALLVALLATGVGFAQTNAPAAQTQTLQTVKATGKLELIQGAIGLKANGKTYILPGLGRLAGFIPGVVEGGTVTVEGYERALPYTTDVVMLQVTKLTVNGKDYDLSQAWAGKGMMGGYGQMMNGRGGMMRGGRW